MCKNNTVQQKFLTLRPKRFLHADFNAAREIYIAHQVPEKNDVKVEESAKTNLFKSFKLNDFG